MEIILSLPLTFFFKWAEVDPLPDKTAHGVAKLLYSIVKYCSSAFLLVVIRAWLCRKGVLSHFPPKFKNIFVVVITFSPFLLCK